jgi:thiol:disulfide interchange protein DsbC
VTGFYEVSIGASIAYASQDGKYVFMGDLLDMTSKSNLTEAKRTASRKQLIDQVGEKNMIVMAPKQVKHTITVFTDIDCGYCRKLHQDVPALNKDGVKVRYLAFPRSGPGTESFRKYEYVWCAKDRVKAVTNAKAGGPIEEKNCSNPIARQYELGQRVGVEGTPAIVLENGEMLPGYLPPAKLLEAITMSESRQAAR